MPPADASPREIAGDLQALRAASDALRARPPAEVRGALADALALLRDHASPARRRWEAELPGVTGFHPAVVRDGLQRALDAWTPQAFLALAAEELPPAWDPTEPRTHAVIAGGALPTPTLLSILAPLARGSAVLLRPSRHDAVTPAVVAEALAAVDAGLAGALRQAAFPRGDTAALYALLEADAIVATGSDAVVDSIARRAPPGRRVTRHGHRLSVAVLGPEAGPDAFGALARDVFAWDQLGCLSPVACFFLGREAIPEALLEQIANAFAELSKSLPRGRIPPESQAAWADAWATAEMRAASGSVGLRAGADATFALVAEPDAVLRATPLHRFLRLHPAPEIGHLEAALSPARGHLAGAGLGGLGRHRGPTEEALAVWGASRVCPVGELQAPPLSWRRDGRPVLA